MPSAESGLREERGLADSNVKSIRPMNASVEEDIGVLSLSDGAAHVLGEEGEADLEGGIHPAETLAWDILKVESLVAVFGVNHVGHLDRIKLLRHRAVEVDKCTGQHVNPAVR